METDPFTQVYVKLWELLSDNPVVTSSFKTGNLIDMSNLGRRAYLEPTVATADLPELLLVPYGTVARIHSSSSGTMVTKQFQWVLTTGDLRVNRHLFPLSWAILTSIIRAQKDLRALTYDGHKFVKRVDLTSSSDGQSQAQRDSNINGWSTVQAIEVEMHFQTSALIDGATTL